MSPMSKSAATVQRPALAALAMVLLFTSVGVLAGGGAGALGLRAPRLDLIAQASAAIQVHLASALAAFLIGAVLLLGAKGTLSHRALGWAWAGAMGATAVSSFFIHQVIPGGLSLIHALSGWVVVALPVALYAARRHKVQLHRRSMTGLYFGGMFLAGGLAFLPGRLLGQVFFG